MIKDDLQIKNLVYGDAVKKLAELKNIELSEARSLISNMSFTEYRDLFEAGAAITPPSGNTIGSSASPGTQNSPQPNAGKPKMMWAGKGSPTQVGMTVGLKGPDGLPVPGEISQVDTAAKGVKVRNPTTGQEEWTNIDALEPFDMQQNQPGQPTTEQQDLQRLRELAGIRENCSAGATGAGAIAVAPAAMGSVKRRQPTKEQKKEYTPTQAKTIVGDTKPSQASGELSATLAANGKKTASRINNGLKK